jgi:putative acetyltransferase
LTQRIGLRERDDMNMPMPRDITIRQASPLDAPRIHELHLASVRALCARSYAPAILEGWLANRSPDGYLRGIASGALFVAEADGEIVGFCEGVVREVRAVFVDPRWVGRGVGSALLAQALTIAGAGASRPVRLESTLNAVTFYERHGFRQISQGTVRRNQLEIPIVVMEGHAG